MRLNVFRAVTLTLIALGSIILVSQSNPTPTQAQSGNLLQNGNLEGNYVGQLGLPNFSIPPNWTGFWFDSPRTADWQNIEPLAFEASNPARNGTALEMGRGQATFTGGIYQQVSGIQEGTRLRATGYVYIRNASGAIPQARIGIGSNVGGNPQAGTITWSGWTRQLNSWSQMTVEVVVPAGNVTVFIYATQTWPNDPNVFYFDEISLTVGGTGEEVGADATQAPTAPPPPPVVPFVAPQGPQDDGSIVHTVGEGDTVASIAVAYGVRPDNIIELNNLANPRFIRIGQRLLIRPPGSVEIPTATPNPALPTPVTNAGGNAGGPITGQPAQPTLGGPVVGQAAPPTPGGQQPGAGGVAVGGGPLPDEGLCVMLFEDRNQNGVRDVGENPLPDATIELFTDVGSAAAYRTSGQEPFCFSPQDVGPGTYITLATAPDGFTLTTPSIFNVRVVAGARSNLIFGAARNVRII